MISSSPLSRPPTRGLRAGAALLQVSTVLPISHAARAVSHAWSISVSTSAVRALQRSKPGAARSSPSSRPPRHSTTGAAQHSAAKDRQCKSAVFTNWLHLISSKCSAQFCQVGGLGANLLTLVRQATPAALPCVSYTACQHVHIAPCCLAAACVCASKRSIMTCSVG